MSTERALLAGLMSALAEDVGVQAVLGDPPRIHDERPRDAAFPCVTLNRVETRASDSAESAALEHAITLHVWSRYGGRAEALDVLSALRAALHDQNVSVEGRRVVLLSVVFTDVFRDGDGQTTHGVLRLRAITEPE